jgi:hypothetical protein
MVGKESPSPDEVLNPQLLQSEEVRRVLRGKDVHIEGMGRMRLPRNYTGEPMSS